MEDETLIKPTQYVSETGPSQFVLLGARYVILPIPKRKPIHPVCKFYQVLPNINKGLLSYEQRTKNFRTKAVFYILFLVGNSLPTRPLITLRLSKTYF